MLRRLFGRGSVDPVPSVDRKTKVPDGYRIYAIGDIHGRIDLLEDLHARIRTDRDRVGDRRCVIVYLGDYVDRGMHSREVLDCLLERPLPGFESVHLIGNHDQILIDFLKSGEVGIDWLKYGGDMTLFSYGIPLSAAEATPELMQHARVELCRRFPLEHADFLDNLHLYYIAGDFMFVHAGIRPGVAIDKQDQADLMWIRKDFLTSPKDHGKIVVHGHTVVKEVEMHPNRIAVDTGAYATGTLSCLILDGQDRFVLKT